MADLGPSWDGDVSVGETWAWAGSGLMRLSRKRESSRHSGNIDREFMVVFSSLSVKHSSAVEGASRNHRKRARSGGILFSPGEDTSWLCSTASVSSQT